MAENREMEQAMTDMQTDRERAGLVIFRVWEGEGHECRKHGIQAAPHFEHNDPNWFVDLGCHSCNENSDWSSYPGHEELKEGKPYYKKAEVRFLICRAHNKVKCEPCVEMVDCVALELAKVREAAHAEMQAACAAICRIQKVGPSAKLFADLIEKYVRLDGTNALEEMLENERAKWKKHIADAHYYLDQAEVGAKGMDIAARTTAVQRRVDEAVAAVVEELIAWIWKTRSLPTPKVSDANKGKRFLFSADRDMVAQLRSVKTNHPQILAERDKRVREEAEGQQRELREDKDAEIRLLQKQLQDLSLRLNKRCEICSQTWPVGRMHNCYFCKSWVCEGCAKEHFRLHESEKARRELGEKG